MAMVPHLRWLGIGAVVVVVVWVLSRRGWSRVVRLGVRCLAVAAALTPQPLWIPGEGGALMPALALLVAVRPSVFSFTMGAVPISTRSRGSGSPAMPAEVSGSCTRSRGAGS